MCGHPLHGKATNPATDVPAATQCTGCGFELPNKVAFCPQCGKSVNSNNSGHAGVTRNDKPSIGLNILSFLFPLIGLILYFALRASDPQKARSAGKYALFGFIAGIALGVIIAALVAILATVSYNNWLSGLY